LKSLIGRLFQLPSRIARLLSWLPEIFSLEVFSMTRSRFFLSFVLSVACFASGVLVAQGPRHPNLRAAQDLINRAYDRITAAQLANEWDMNGHAEKAKALLDQAKVEIGLAAEDANHH
jgi:hypothetical protein